MSEEPSPSTGPAGDPLNEQDVTPGFRFEDPADVFFGALSEPPWISRPLQLCPGRAPIFGGYGGTGKTIALMSLAVSVMTGKKAWGQFPTCGPSTVVHIDYEQGPNATKWRYRRLAHGHGVSQDELRALVADRRLRLASFPDVYLTSPGAYDHLCRAFEGASLATIDAFRGATPGEDENDSKMRRYLDLVSRASVATQCTALILAHSRKGDDKGAQLLRGSSAIYDGAGAVFMMTADNPNDPKRVEQTRASQDARGAILDPFYLRIEDVEVSGDPKGGLRVRYQTQEQVKAPQAPAERLTAAVTLVIETVKANPGKGTKALYELMTGKGHGKKALDAALEEAERIGRITNKSKGRGRSWFAVE